MLELIRSLFFFRSLPFRLCLDHSFKELPLQQRPLFFQRLVPVVLRVQRYCFFLSVQHFRKIFLIYFWLFLYTLNLNALHQTWRLILLFLSENSACFSTFSASFQQLFRRKISQIRHFSWKTEAFPWMLLPRKVTNRTRKALSAYLAPPSRVPLHLCTSAPTVLRPQKGTSPARKASWQRKFLHLIN